MVAVRGIELTRRPVIGTGGSFREQPRTAKILHRLFGGAEQTLRQPRASRLRSDCNPVQLVACFGAGNRPKAGVTGDAVAGVVGDQETVAGSFVTFGEILFDQLARNRDLRGAE